VREAEAGEKSRISLLKLSGFKVSSLKGKVNDKLASQQSQYSLFLPCQQRRRVVEKQQRKK